MAEEEKKLSSMKIYFLFYLWNFFSRTKSEVEEREYLGKSEAKCLSQGRKDKKIET